MKETSGNGLVELYRIHRPTKFEQLVGQPTAVSALESMIEHNTVPHVLLLTGPSGTGKTTIARIMKGILKCGDLDYEEVNCPSVEAPIQKVREIRNRMKLAPISGSVRFWLLDEFQSLSRAGFAQQALLEMLEDTPEHVYFILATTDPDKIIKAIHTRCTRINLNAVSHEDLCKLVKRIAKKEELDISDTVISKIAETANGSPRAALVTLHRVAYLGDSQLDAIYSNEVECQSIAIARALMGRRARWIEVANILKEIKDEPESVRNIILAYCNNVLLGGGKNADQANMIISRMSDPFYGAAGRALLTSACYDILK